MRRASICGALCGAIALGAPAAIALGAPAAASAAPVVHLRAKAVPIPKQLDKKRSPNWPHTGNILGAPAAVEAVFTIKGSEYNGFPAPLRQVVVYLPKGVKLHPNAFKTCPTRLLASAQLYKCPKASLASPPGEARGEVQFGTQEPVKETVKVQAYFMPGRGLGFWIEGKAPVQIEEVGKGSITHAGGPFSLSEITEVPLIVPTVGSHAASAEFIKVKIGAAHKKGSRLISYGTMPNRCPKHGFPVKAKLTFGVAEGEQGAAGASPTETVTVTSTAPCPRMARGRNAHR